VAGGRDVRDLEAPRLVPTAAFGRSATVARPSQTDA